jgi:hypothetical protein
VIQLIFGKTNLHQGRKIFDFIKQLRQYVKDPRLKEPVDESYSKQVSHVEHSKAKCEKNQSFRLENLPEKVA